MGLRRFLPVVLTLMVAATWWWTPLRGSDQLQPQLVLAQVTPIVEQATAEAGTTVRLALRVTLPAGLHLQSNKPRDPTLIPATLTVDEPVGLTVREVVFPLAIEFDQEGSDEPLDVFEEEFLVGLQVEIASDHEPGAVVIPARFRYQACDDKLCFRPQTAETAWTFTVAASAAPTRTQPEVFDAILFGTGDAPAEASSAAPAATGAPVLSTDRAAAGLTQLAGFRIVSPTNGYMNTADFLTFVDNAEAGVMPTGWFEGRGLFAILLITAIGGLALNLTPCVLPMIPINLAIIGAGSQAGKRHRGFVLGLAYGGAMALVYGVLGVVVILTAGTFGTINASPWFNLSIAALFVVLALAMFDVITIDFSRLSSRIKFGEQNRGTLLLAFSMGAVAALLAGACVAPVVIQVILFASDMYVGGSTIALALPFFLGLGMALPWPIAGAGMAALPKPGLWMVRVKQAFGVIIMATALYYGYVAYGIFANRWVDPETVRASIEEQLAAGWYSSLDDGLAAASADGSPVLLDLWATWCKNCVVMDKTTLADPQVKAALEGYTKIKVQAEDPDVYPTNELMKRIGAIGLPAYVILERN